MGHKIPQNYLEGFQIPDEPGMIWQYDTQTGSWSKARISKVAQQRNYYRPEIEQLLARFEGPAHAALDRLRLGRAIGDRDRELLVLYLGAMLFRGAKKRRMAREMCPEVFRDCVREVREDLLEVEGCGQMSAELVAKLLRKLTTAEHQFGTRIPPWIEEIIRDPRPTPAVLNCLAGMTWRIVRAEGDICVPTCDSPVHYFPGLGMGPPEAEVTLPISSDVVLLANRQGRSGATAEVTAKAALFREITRRIVSNAERFIYHHERAAWLAKMVAKRDRHRLNRIVWWGVRTSETGPVRA